MAIRLKAALGFATVLVCIAAAPAGAFATPFLNGLSTLSSVGGTVPANGDLNPYGVANVPQSIGSLVRGDTLVSNFNDSENLQGTGSTIVQLSPAGNLSLFAELKASSLPGPCPGGVGLTTALAVLPGGYVVVGSTPSTNGKAAGSGAGCLIVLDSTGKAVETISGPPINGPWDLSATSFLGTIDVLYVTNVLNGTVAAEGGTVDRGTVARLVLLRLPGQPPRVVLKNVIATGLPERTDEAAFVVGPTGTAIATGQSWFDQTLYVADTVDNRIAEVPNALLRLTPASGGGRTLATGGDLDDPLGMTLAPNGDILTANGENAKLVETSRSGKEVASFATEVGAGGLFGLSLTPNEHGVLFVDDNTNTLDLLN